ncbi:phage GP46 family protein [Morganella morganii]|uniref:phage GP46 family protein n=1 Tax=Morganella morganii TaxID=582 RepID=UPI001DD77014|nr:phage GP46 family protein [Morganella morganii]HDT4951578.1 phage GP46 family protein [Morganella morganii subsp. morganii]EKU4289235.1 phage GP46 family protein [Morganella morganii]EKU4304662.1 phage GP46 family protein [Morganella morganii]EKU5663784.1 phage GP46 family protein [Morganella morganii]EKU5691128.1 phage GP46 family protein [Morganella morganii]
MSDISSWWNADTLRADWIAGNGDLLSGDDLQSAIMISLFTDRLAHSDDDYDDEYRRGWWADTATDGFIGSRLWLLRRQKLTTQVAKKAEDYAREALAWLITDGVVSDIQIRTQIVWPQRLNMVIRYHRPDSGAEDLRFYWVWEKQ